MGPHKARRRAKALHVAAGCISSLRAGGLQWLTPFTCRVRMQIYVMWICPVHNAMEQDRLDYEYYRYEDRRINS